MPGFFEAAANFNLAPKKIYTVNIQGKTVQVSLERKKEIMQVGEDLWHWEGDKIVRKPVPKTKKGYSVLMISEKGYVFYKGNPYWPEGIKERGYTWQIPSE
tara:strand:+ start:595 stop:897 length:303 start_codon:yes stop_codon:yes gene_type:complete